jgi:hypothetical protein
MKKTKITNVDWLAVDKVYLTGVETIIVFDNGPIEIINYQLNLDEVEEELLKQNIIFFRQKNDTITIGYNEYQSDAEYTYPISCINYNAIASITSLGSTGSEVTFTNGSACWINYGGGRRELILLICELEERGAGKSQEGSAIEWYNMDSDLPIILWQMNDIAEDGNYEGKTEEEQEDYTFDSLDWTITIK